MKIKNYFGLLTLCILTVFACSNDDEDEDFVVAPLRDRLEQQVIDVDSLQNYFNSHYYNSASFVSGMNYSINDIVITELEAGETLPDGNTLLSEAVETLTTTYEDITYEYYILKINQGGGAISPAFTDKVSVTYEGSLVTDAFVFDSAVTPVNFDLVGTNELTNPGVIVGWQRVLPYFNTALSFTTGSNVEYNDYGLGVMFLPSGLAYFGVTRTNIPSYSNLIFKFALLQAQEIDHDNDGVPSYIEDLNANLSTFDDDTDADTFANYVDVDDDGDGVLTINEDLNEDGDPTNDDSDNDGIPNYLDTDSTESNEDN